MNRDEGTPIGLKFLWLGPTLLSPRLWTARFLFDTGLCASQVPFYSLRYSGEKLLSIRTSGQGKVRGRRIRNTNIEVSNCLSQKNEKLSSADLGLVTEVANSKVRGFGHHQPSSPFSKSLTYNHHLEKKKKNSIFPEDIPRREFLSSIFISFGIWNLPLRDFVKQIH